MAAATDEYKKLVLEDIENYIDLGHPLHSGILERLLIRKVSLKKLHPNPDDEFSMADIGPNYGIIGNYEKEFRHMVATGNDPLGSFGKEPLVVEKLSTGGYMILNGHHRWMAAYRTGIKKIDVQIVNVTHEEDIIANINQSERKMCVSFDLDEILLTDGVVYTADKKLAFPANRVFEKGLRHNAANLIKELQRQGFDVWIYTANYHSEKYIRALFKLYNANPDGVINGLSRNRSKGKIKDAFINKYELSVHIDNEEIIVVNTKTKEYETLEIEPGEASWASNAIALIKKHRGDLEEGLQETSNE